VSPASPKVPDTKGKGKIITVEEREIGDVDMKVYKGILLIMNHGLIYSNISLCCICWRIYLFDNYFSCIYFRKWTFIR
jgi:hypothetical protein